MSEWDKFLNNLEREKEERHKKAKDEREAERLRVENSRDRGIEYLQKNVVPLVDSAKRHCEARGMKIDVEITRGTKLGMQKPTVRFQPSARKKKLNSTDEFELTGQSVWISHDGDELFGQLSDGPIGSATQKISLGEVEALLQKSVSDLFAKL